MSFSSIVASLIIIMFCLNNISFASPQRIRYGEMKTRKLFQKGLEHYNEGRFYSALDMFRRLKDYPEGQNPQLTASYLMEMRSYFHIKKFEDAKLIGRSFLLKYPQSRYRFYIMECFGDVFAMEGNYRLAVDNYIKSRNKTDNSVHRTIIDSKLIRLLNGYLTNSEIDELLSTEIDSVNRSILSLILANNFIYKGEMDKAALTLFRLDVQKLPAIYKEAYNLARRHTYKEPRKSVMVGLVLPLSGFNADFGRDFLEGIQNAVSYIRKYNNLDIVLEVMDNGGDNLRTVSCVEILAKNSNVLAIIGPLSTNNSAIAGASARERDIPILIPFSAQVGLSDLGENIFQLKTDLYKQGRFAAEYAIIDLQKDTLAIVAPADRLGKELTDGFVKRADELGAQIVAIEWYSGIPTDLSVQFKNIRKVGFDLMSEKSIQSFSDLEFNEIDNIFEISVTDFFPEEIYMEESGEIDSSRIDVTTIQGIYLPIHSGDINYIGSQFSSYHLNTVVIGNSGWYDIEVLNQEMIGPHLSGMIILTDYLEPRDQLIQKPMSKLNEQDSFIEKNRWASIGRDVMGYFVAQIGDDYDRISIMNNLKRGVTYRGSGKIISFSSTTPRVNSSMHVLQYKNGRFRKIGEFLSDMLQVSETQSP